MDNEEYLLALSDMFKEATRSMEMLNDLIGAITAQLDRISRTNNSFITEPERRAKTRGELRKIFYN